MMLRTTSIAPELTSITTGHHGVAMPGKSEGKPPPVFTGSIALLRSAGCRWVITFVEENKGEVDRIKSGFINFLPIWGAIKE